MNETLKELRRAAELDLSGGQKNDQNKEDLKKVLNKTVKATKVARGSEVEKEKEVRDDNEDHVDIKKEDSESSEKEDGADDDVMMDIDGLQKSKVTSYGNSDSEVEASGELDEESHGEEQPVDQKLKKDMETHKHIFREKHSKYL